MEASHIHNPPLQPSYPRCRHPLGCSHRDIETELMQRIKDPSELSLLDPYLNDVPAEFTRDNIPGFAEK